MSTLQNSFCTTFFTLSCDLNQWWYSTLLWIFLSSGTPKNIENPSNWIPVLAHWPHQTTGHYLIQRRPSSLSTCGLTRPKWVKLNFSFVHCLIPGWEVLLKSCTAVTTVFFAKCQMDFWWILYIFTGPCPQWVNAIRQIFPRQHFQMHIL